MLSGRKLNSVELDVKLTAEEAIRRISSVVDKAKPFSIFRHTGDNPIIGKIKGSSFRIWLKKDYANSWSQILYGTVKPGKAGCRIHGRFGEYWFVRLFTIVLLGMIAFFVP